jgi:hypothetical protein
MSFRRLTAQKKRSSEDMRGDKPAPASSDERLCSLLMHIFIQLV